jgi:hypothetical protein
LKRFRDEAWIGRLIESREAQLFDRNPGSLAVDELHLLLTISLKERSAMEQSVLLERTEAAGETRRRRAPRRGWKTSGE